MSTVKSGTPVPILAALRRHLAFLPVAVAYVLDRVAAGPRALKLIEKAEALGRDHRFEEAVAAWQAVAARYPRYPLATAGHAGALRRAGRPAEALAVLDAAIARKQRGPAILYELAMARLALRRPDDALAAGLENLASFPGHPLAYESTAYAYRALRRFEEADTLLRDAVERCPGIVGIACEYAVNADVTSDREEALARWQQVHRSFPKASIGYAGLGAALKQLGRFDEADGVLGEGMALHPDDVNIAVNHAWVAEARADWAGAALRWEAVRSRFPTHPRVQGGWTEALTNARLEAVDTLSDRADDAGQTPLPPLVEPPSALETGHADLFRRFESLGETCEFGFVQRHYEAAPLGLLRWAGISHHQSRLGLMTAFDGVGSAASTELHVNQTNNEYFTTDKTFGMSMHSFIQQDTAPADVVLPKLRRRLAYLRDKLLEDLRAGEKIFVLQTGPDVPDAVFTEYHAALCRYNRNRLLCVRPATGTKVPGTLEVVGDGLMFGWLDQAGYDGRSWNVSFAVWLRLCEAAMALSDRADPASPAIKA